MAKKISECTGARVHASLIKDRKGIAKISWRVNYKTEGIWCNNEADLLKVLKDISATQTLGEEFKPWKLGEKGWNKNADYKEIKI